jgi:hypothetical protein
MRLKLGGIIVCVVSLVVAGCGGGAGGGGQHTYILTPTNALAAGLYVTVISPVAFPQKVLNSKGVTLVEHASGPEMCSYSKKIEGVKGKYAAFNGKTVTVKINGSNPFIGQVCSALKKGGFNPTNIAGH